MVLQIAGAVVIPLIMLLVAASPFDEPINVEPSDPLPSENIESVYFTFFILWMIWLLILTRILYQVGKRTFKVRRGF